MIKPAILGKNTVGKMSVGRNADRSVNMLSRVRTPAASSDLGRRTTAGIDGRTAISPSRMITQQRKVGHSSAILSRSL
jgi:hypothetical protein